MAFALAVHTEVGLLFELAIRPLFFFFVFVSGPAINCLVSKLSTVVAPAFEGLLVLPFVLPSGIQCLFFARRGVSDEELMAQSQLAPSSS